MDDKQKNDYEDILELSDSEIELMFEDVIEGPSFLIACKAGSSSHYSYSCMVSDERLKDIISDSTAGLKEINALSVKNYVYKHDTQKIPRVGVTAQELMKVFPNSVFKDFDGYYKINTDEIFYAMLNSIQELSKQNQQLQAKLDLLMDKYNG